MSLDAFKNNSKYGFKIWIKLSLDLKSQCHLMLE